MTTDQPCHHEWVLSLEHGYLECQKCWSLMPPPGKDWNLNDLKKMAEGMTTDPLPRYSTKYIVDRLFNRDDRWVKAADADARVQALRAKNVVLRRALELIESVYRQNCVAEGEPSSVLEAVQAALKGGVVVSGGSEAS
jgi:hypothetical protein